MKLLIATWSSITLRHCVQKLQQQRVPHLYVSCKFYVGLWLRRHLLRPKRSLRSVTFQYRNVMLRKQRCRNYVTLNQFELAAGVLAAAWRVWSSSLTCRPVRPEIVARSLQTSSTYRHRLLVVFIRCHVNCGKCNTTFVCFVTFTNLKSFYSDVLLVVKKSAPSSTIYV